MLNKPHLFFIKAESVNVMKAVSWNELRNSHLVCRCGLCNTIFKTSIATLIAPISIQLLLISTLCPIVRVLLPIKNNYSGLFASRGPSDKIDHQPARPIELVLALKKYIVIIKFSTCIFLYNVNGAIKMGNCRR